MPTIFTHAVVGAAVAAPFWRPDVPKGVWVAGVACAMLPDLDTAAFAFGVPYGHMLGHRGLTHSIAFAAVLPLVVILAFFGEPSGLSRPQLWLYLFLATASHGVLDALTNGGRGVAFFAPFTGNRYFFPATPIDVSPIGVFGFFSPRGWRVLGSELRWVWIPSFGLAAAILLLRFGARLRWPPTGS